MKRLTLGYLVAVFLFIGVFIVDSYFISYMLKNMPYITHWRILFPTLIPLFLTFGFAAILGMYRRQFWGFLITYLVIAFLIGCLYVFYFDLLEYHRLPITYLIDMITANVLAMIYIFFFHKRHQSSS